MNMTYITDPNEVEALVGAIKSFFADAAERQCVDIGRAVEMLTTAVRLVDPNYTPPEPEEVEACASPSDEPGC
jgi:hypothetical protein